MTLKESRASHRILTIRQCRDYGNSKTNYKSTIPSTQRSFKRDNLLFPWLGLLSKKKKKEDKQNCKDTDKEKERETYLRAVGAWRPARGTARSG